MVYLCSIIVKHTGILFFPGNSWHYENVIKEVITIVQAYTLWCSVVQSGPGVPFAYMDWQ